MRTHLHTRSSWSTWAVAGLLCAGTTLAAAAYEPSSLGLGSNLNLLVFNDLTAASYSDVQGHVAVGGNAAMGMYAINTTGSGALYPGTALTVAGDLNFSNGVVWGDTVVGGNLNAGNSATFKGSVQVGGNLNANHYWLSANSLVYGGSSAGIQEWQNPLPQQAPVGSAFALGLDFAAERARLTRLSQQFDTLSNSGSSSTLWGNVVLNANGAELAVFDLDAADVGRNLELTQLAGNTTVLINVHGSTVNFSNHGYTNFSSGRVLFNLSEAVSITFEGAVNASFLAPLADFNALSGAINGQVIVQSWSGSAQVNDAAFTGVITAVPEPATLVMLLAGLVMIGTLQQRKSRH